MKWNEIELELFINTMIGDDWERLSPTKRILILEKLHEIQDIKKSVS